MKIRDSQRLVPTWFQTSASFPWKYIWRCLEIKAILVTRSLLWLGQVVSSRGSSPGCCQVTRDWKCYFPPMSISLQLRPTCSVQHSIHYYFCSPTLIFFSYFGRFELKIPSTTLLANITIGLKSKMLVNVLLLNKSLCGNWQWFDHLTFRHLNWRQ